MTASFRSFNEGCDNSVPSAYDLKSNSSDTRTPALPPIAVGPPKFVRRARAKPPSQILCEILKVWLCHCGLCPLYPQKRDIRRYEVDVIETGLIRSLNDEQPTAIRPKGIQ